MLGHRIPRRIRTRRSSASTSSRCRSPHRRRRDIVNRPRIFADTGDRRHLGTLAGRRSRAGDADLAVTNQCHDITVFPEIGLAAGACSGNGILMDISRSGASGPPRSRRRQELRLLAFGDLQQRRHQGRSSPTNGAAARGRAAAPPIRRPGAPTRSSTSSIASCRFAGYYKMPAAQTEQENCVAHNGGLIPVPGRDIMVAGVVSGRRLGVRFHRLGPSGRDRVLRSRSDRRQDAHHRRLLVDLLVQRRHLRLGDRPRHRRVQADSRASIFRRTKSTPRCSFGPASSTRRNSRASSGRPTRWWRGRIVDQLTRRNAHRAGARRAPCRPRWTRADGLRNGREKGAAAILDRLDALAAAAR